MSAFPNRTGQVLLSTLNECTYREMIVRSYYVPREGTYHEVLDIDHNDVRDVCEQTVSKWIDAGVTVVVKS